MCAGTDGAGSQTEGPHYESQSMEKGYIIAYFDASQEKEVVFQFQEQP